MGSSPSPNSVLQLGSYNYNACCYDSWVDTKPLKQDEIFHTSAASHWSARGIDSCDLDLCLFNQIVDNFVVSFLMKKKQLLIN